MPSHCSVEGERTTGNFSALVSRRRTGRAQARQHQPRPRRAATRQATAIMESVPGTPDQQTRTAVTTRYWPVSQITRRVIWFLPFMRRIFARAAVDVSPRR